MTSQEANHARTKKDQIIHDKPKNKSCKNQEKQVLHDQRRLQSCNLIEPLSYALQQIAANRLLTATNKPLTCR